MSSEAYWLLSQPAGPPPVDEAKLRIWKRAGMSISGVILNPRHNRKEIIRIYNGCGVNFTRVNYLATSWVNPLNVMPFFQEADGRWNLFKWRQEYFDRVQETRELFNAAGIVMQGTLFELYSISIRKSEPMFLAKSPWRYNVNGISWGVPKGDETDKKADAIMLAKTMPDEWGEEFISKLAPIARWDLNPVEIGNEMPEKSLHERTRDIIRKYSPKAIITVNRNEDTPGQYANMKIGQNYDMIAFHGRKLKRDELRDASGKVIRKSDLDVFYPEHISSVPTFRMLLEDHPELNKYQIIFSSDGARRGDNDPVNTYDYGDLKGFFREVYHKYGCSIEHQSRAKMTEEPNHHMIEDKWFESVIKP